MSFVFLGKALEFEKMQSFLKCSHHMGFEIKNQGTFAGVVVTEFFFSFSLSSSL